MISTLVVSILFVWLTCPLYTCWRIKQQLQNGDTQWLLPLIKTPIAQPPLHWQNYAGHGKIYLQYIMQTRPPLYTPPYHSDQINALLAIPQPVHMRINILKFYQHINVCYQVAPLNQKTPLTYTLHLFLARNHLFKWQITSALIEPHNCPTNT